ncbi:MAG: hypothetical protein WAQ88_08240 [Caldicoprobacterales bacterium]
MKRIMIIMCIISILLFTSCEAFKRGFNEGLKENSIETTIEESDE